MTLTELARSSMPQEASVEPARRLSEAAVAPRNTCGAAVWPARISRQPMVTRLPSGRVNVALVPG